MMQNVMFALLALTLALVALSGAPTNQSTTPKPIPVRDADCFVHRLQDPTFREERIKRDRRGKRR